MGLVWGHPADAVLVPLKLESARWAPVELAWWYLAEAWLGRRVDAFLLELGFLTGVP